MARNTTYTKSAVALTYEPGSGAPKVVAKGSGHIAEKIIATAKENGVFVHESKELVSLLSKVDLDSEIPSELYTIIAELLAWLYYLENSHEDQSQHLSPSQT